MGLSDGALFMIKMTPLPNGNHPILSPIGPMGVADTLEPHLLNLLSQVQSIFNTYKQIHLHTLFDIYRHVMCCNLVPNNTTVMGML